MKNPAKNDDGVRSGESISLQDAGAAAHPVLDIVYLERQVLGDAELRDELLRLYAGQLVALGPLICAEPGPARSTAAHTLKGASLAIGALALAHLCQNLEHQDREHQDREHQDREHQDREHLQPAQAPGRDGGEAGRREAALLIEATRRRVAELLRS